ncbi:MAG: nitroreductase family protein [Acidobacteria bacterium]|nr:nitroreductase family protein [Acidobacteriota bacterium]
MNIKELLQKTRSYRRFDQSVPVPMEVLKDIIENTRYTSSAMNKQPLSYILITNHQLNEKIFVNLKWAASLKDWDGPVEGEKPTGYIIMLSHGDNKVTNTWDAGIALETIALSLMEKEYASCAILSFNKNNVKSILDVPDDKNIEIVIAVGKPGEKIVIDDAEGDKLSYWRDEDDTHHVPKRRLGDRLFKIYE